MKMRRPVNAELMRDPPYGICLSKINFFKQTQHNRGDAYLLF